MYEIYVASQFEAAHRLSGDFGPASRLHGHTYRLEALVRGERLAGNGTLYDIGALRPAVEELASELHMRDLEHDRRDGRRLLLGAAGPRPLRRRALDARGAHLGVAPGVRSPR